MEHYTSKQSCLTSSRLQSTGIYRMLSSLQRLDVILSFIFDSKNLTEGLKLLPHPTLVPQDLSYRLGSHGKKVGLTTALALLTRPRKGQAA